MLTKKRSILSFFRTEKKNQTYVTLSVQALFPDEVETEYRKFLANLADSEKDHRKVADIKKEVKEFK